MTTQDDHRSADLADHDATASQPATDETTGSHAASPAAPGSQEGRESTTADGDGQPLQPAPHEGSGTAAATDRGAATAEPAGEAQGSAASPGANQATGSSQGQLVSPEAAMDFKARWEAIQQGFVDDPRSAVSDADTLVSDVLQQLSNGFDEQHRQLEGQWSDGEPDTEGLRSALQRYRDFFDRLLTI
jgi:hypothetical protein